MPEILGKQVSKGTIWIGVGAAGLLGIALVRYNQQKKSTDAAAATAAAAQAPGTGDGTSDGVDPQTGFPYGSTEDAAALTADAGYNSPLGGLGYSNQAYNYGVPSATYPTNGLGFTSNAQWSQAAETFLTGEGADANVVGNALGKYITGQPVTDATAQGYINQAIAFEGYPPVSGPNGFPPSIQTGPTSSPVPPTTTPANVTIPDLAGKTSAQAFATLRAEALNPGPGGIKSTRIVLRTVPGAGASVPKHTAVRVYVK